ncbi:MAG: hypothetical protein AAGG48_32045 [Planctomycetota bacterium]
MASRRTRATLGFVFALRELQQQTVLSGLTEAGTSPRSRLFLELSDVQEDWFVSYGLRMMGWLRCGVPTVTRLKHAKSRHG